MKAESILFVPVAPKGYTKWKHSNAQRDPPGVFESIVKGGSFLLCLLEMYGNTADP